MQSYAASTKAALSHVTSWLEQTNIAKIEATGSSLYSIPASASQYEQIVELDGGDVTYKTNNNYKGEISTNSVFYSAQIGTTQGRGSWRYSRHETFKRDAENIDKGRDDTYQVMAAGAANGTTINFGGANTKINEASSIDVWSSFSSAASYQDVKSTSNVGVFNSTRVAFKGATTACSPNSSLNNTNPTSTTSNVFTDTATSTFGTKHTNGVLKETVQTGTSKGVAIPINKTTGKDSTFNRSYFTDEITKSIITETTISKRREEGLPASFMEYVSTLKTYSYKTNILTSTTFKDTVLTATSSSNLTYHNTAGTVETKTKEGESEDGPCLPVFTARKGYYQPQPNGPNWGFVIDVKTEAKEFTENIFLKLTDLTKSIHTTNTKVSVSYELQQTKIPFTKIIHKTSSFTYKGSTFTRNFYDNIPEKTITVQTGTGPAATSLYSKNYLTFYNYFSTYTHSQVVHYKYSKCSINTSLEYGAVYTNTYTFLSDLSTTYTETYYIDESSKNTKVTRNTAWVGYTSSSSTYVYAVPVKTTLTQISPAFAFIETNDPAVVSSSSTSNSFSNGGQSYLQGQTKIFSSNRQIGCTEVPVFIKHNNTFLPAYRRPLGESCLMEAFPDAYAGFIVTKFDASSVKNYYVTTESSILSGKAPTNYHISNLNYIYLAPNLKGFSKNYIPDTVGNYPYTYFDPESVTARTSISLTTSSSSSRNNSFTNVLVKTTTTMGSTTATCHTTNSSFFTYSFSIFTSATSTTLTSRKRRLDSIETSAIINAVFLTTDNKTFETTTLTLTKAPNITQTILIGGTTTASSLLTASHYDVLTTSSRDPNRLFESTVKVKVNVATKLPNKKFMESITLSVYSKAGVSGLETSFYNFNGGYNPKGGDYSVYLDKNAVTLTEISGTVSRTRSHSALTNISISVPNGRYFAIAAEPLICQYRSTATGGTPEALSFQTSIKRSPLN
jgi:hypothetical protein